MATKKTIPDHFYPSEPRARAAVDEYLEWQHNNTRLGCAIYFQIKKRIGPFAAISDNPDEGAMPIFKFLMESTLDGFETLWLRDKKFLASNEISFADILAACEIEQPRMTGYDVFGGRPKLKEWYERVKEATSPYYDEAHVIVNKIVARSQKAKL
jgi:glutathione S-transferase